MRCPVCQGKTTVLESDEEGAVQRRRRECLKCGGRTTTIEAPFDDLVASGLRWGQLRTGVDNPKRRYQREWARKNRATIPVEQKRAAWNHQNRRKMARKQAAETGQDVQELYKAWGVEDRRKAG